MERTSWPTRWTQALYPPALFWIVRSAHFTLMRSHFKDAALREQCVMRPSGLSTWLNLRGSLKKLLRFWWAGAEIYLSYRAQRKPPRLSQQPPINLECSASPFGLSLPSVYGDSRFWFSLRELLKLQTKSDKQTHSKDMVWTSLEFSGCHLETHAYQTGRNRASPEGPLLCRWE